MAGKFDYRPDQKKVGLAPLPVLILMIVLTGLNIASFFAIGADTLSIISLVACLIGVFMAARNLIRQKKRQQNIRGKKPGEKS